MNLKNKISVKVILLITASISIVTSCSNDSLEVTSRNDSSVEAIRTNDNGTNLVLIGAYDAYQKIPINEHLLTELRSDNGRANTLNGLFPSIDSYQTPTNFGEGANYWSNNFFVIAQTNLILDNELTETNRVIFGEAYFLRALSYFNLVRAFGRVPYVNRFIQFREEVTEFPQIESAEMYANIASDFQNAIELLSGLDNSERPRNRASEGAWRNLYLKIMLSNTRY